MIRSDISSHAIKCLLRDSDRDTQYDLLFIPTHWFLSPFSYTLDVQYLMYFV
jgi:hypothetical protein